MTPITTPSGEAASIRLHLLGVRFIVPVGGCQPVYTRRLRHLVANMGLHFLEETFYLVDFAYAVWFSEACLVVNPVNTVFHCFILVANTLNTENNVHKQTHKTSAFMYTNICKSPKHLTSLYANWIESGNDL